MQRILFALVLEPVPFRSRRINEAESSLPLIRSGNAAPIVREVSGEDRW